MHRFVVFVAIFAITTLFIFTIKPKTNESQPELSSAVSQKDSAESQVALAVLSNLRAKGHYENTRLAHTSRNASLAVQRKEWQQRQ